MDRTDEALVGLGGAKRVHATWRRGEWILRRGNFDFDVFQTGQEDLRAQALAG
jgi:hypothetical protein